MPIRNETIKFLQIPGLVLLALLSVHSSLFAFDAPEVAVCPDEGRLRALWALSAYLTPETAAETDRATRLLSLSSADGWPGALIRLRWPEALSAWPQSLSLEVDPGRPESPEYLLIEDARPFGGPNLRVVTSQGPGEGAEALEILDRTLAVLTLRLGAARPLVDPLEWLPREDGLEVARGRLRYGVRLGPEEIYLVRFAPGRFTFKPYREGEFGAGEGELAAWAERLPEAAFLINGGQYYPDRTYMGELRRDGRELSAGRHGSWKGFLVSEPLADPEGTAPWTAILDLETNVSGLEPSDFRQAVQSFMILDRLGRVRVLNTWNLASRTALAQDAEGRMVAVMAPGALSLYDFARILKDLQLVQALGLDGGFEAQMLLRSAGDTFLAAGQLSLSRNKSLFLPGYTQTLPTVIAAEPRENFPR